MPFKLDAPFTITETSGGIQIQKTYTADYLIISDIQIHNSTEGESNKVFIRLRPYNWDGQNRNFFGREVIVVYNVDETEFQDLFNSSIPTNATNVGEVIRIKAYEWVQQKLGLQGQYVTQEI